MRTHAFHQRNQRKLIGGRSLPVLKDFVTEAKYEAIQSVYDQNFLGTSVGAWSCIRNIARYMGRCEKRGRERTKGNREERESKTTGCVDAKRERGKERGEFLSIRPITFAFSSRPSYHRTRIITSRSLFARFFFFIFSLSLFLWLSLLSYNAFVIKYDLKAHSLFVPPISRDYRETDAFLLLSLRVFNL